VVVLGEIINTGATTALLETSSDGGATWTRTGGRIEEDNADWYPRLYGVHPTRPDVVFAHADAVEGRNQNSPDDVWATGDGGTTWNKVFAGTGDLPGFAFSPDGTKVLVSGPLDGIQEATVDDALANGPAAFKKIFDGQVWGLNWTADGLYAGNNDFTLDKKPTPFTLGVSHDEGLSFSPLMTVCDVTFATCDPSATMSVCMASWTIADSTPGNGGYKEDYLEGNRCVGSVPTGDAGVTPAQPGSDNSSGCTQSNIRPRRGSSLGALLCAVGLVALKRRQRGRDAASTRSARGTVPKSPRA
jgi:hypothetical protein